MDGSEEQQAQQINTLNQPEIAKPIGEVILGNINPKTLTREEFNKSQDLLFHGGKSKSFTRTRDYTQEQPYSSQTVGQGYYTTSSRESAEFYSKLRFDDDHATPEVVEVLPYKAHMLDMRSKKDSQTNAPVPKELATDFWRFIRQKREQLFPDGPPKTWGGQSWLWNALVDVGSNLMLRIRENRQFDIREMIGLDGDPGMSEALSGIFTEFMHSKNYDGLIFNEGGDRYDQESSGTHIFYNLDVIGDYDTWHQKSPTEQVLDQNKDDPSRIVLEKLSSFMGTESPK
jgi:hypothetical protein